MSYSRILACGATLILSLSACSADVIANVLGPVIEDLLPSESSDSGADALSVSKNPLSSRLNDVQLETEAVSGIFVVNNRQEKYQGNPALAMNSQGDFIVTWAGYDDETARSGNSIFARRFNAAGVALSSEFRVNTEHLGTQQSPELAMNDTGAFVVIWQQVNGAPTHGQVFNAQGKPVGQEFVVHEEASRSVVAMNARGEFIVVWSESQADIEWDIYAQKFNADASPQGEVFRVNSITKKSQQNPAVAMNDTGDFVVAWKASFQDEREDQADIFMRRFSASGQAQGSEVQVNAFTFSAQTLPSIAMNNAGDTVVAWESWNQEEKAGGEGRGVYAQVFDSSGKGISEEIHVNTHMPSHQDEPDVAMDAQGNFVITWESFKQDGSNDGVYAQRFTRGGNKLGGEIKLDKVSEGVQSDPEVTMNASGDFIFTWSSSGYSNEQAEIVAQRYAANGDAL